MEGSWRGRQETLWLGENHLSSGYGEWGGVGGDGTRKIKSNNTCWAKSILRFFKG